MNISSKSFFDLASLAEAAYALFGAHPSARGALEAAGFVDSQINDLLSRWSVVQNGHNSGAGYSSTLFEGADGYVLAFRGTAEFTDDLVSADVLDIVVDGAAIHQIIDMVNEWSRINASGIYSEAKLVTLEAQTLALQTLGAAYLPVLALQNDVIIDLPTNTVKTIVWENSTTNGLGLADEIAAKGLTVTGHSLGGHLAAAFTRLIPEAGADAFTVNGAGFGVLGLSGFASKNVSNLFTMLFGEPGFNEANVLNLYGEKNLEFITQDALLQQPGASLPIFIEQAGVWDNKLGHSAIPMVNTLAVYDLFFRMDNNVLLDDLLSIFNSASNNAAASLENIVKILGKMFNAGDNNIITDDRDSLHSHIDLIRKKSEFINLADKINVVKEVNSEAAQTNFSQFLSLYYLAPFVLEGGEALLQATNSDLYSLWATDKALTAEERNRGKANFSDDWYSDRAAMLSALNAKNKDDSATDTTTNRSANTIHYYDAALGGAPLISESQSSGEETTLIRFGDKATNTLNGGAYDDRLYGDVGNDKLDGLQGNDILEGGTGNDELTGGEGYDILLGGEGADTYIFEGNFGTDVIKDSDGSGSINITGMSSSFTSVQGSDIIFRDTSNKFEAIKIINGSSTDLLITSLTDATTGNVLIKNWSPEKSLGISLTVDTTTIPNTSAGTVNGDGGNNAITLDNLRDSNPNLDISTFTALYADGGGGNDIIMGMLQGNDTLLGGAGDDIISGGFTTALGANASANFQSIAPMPGADSIDGGAGKDFIFAFAGGSIAHGGADDDVLLASGPAYFQFNNLSEVLKDEEKGIAGHRAITRDEVLADFATIKGANLFGDSGNDYLVGGLYADYLSGGADNDTIFAGAGNDIVEGGDGFNRAANDNIFMVRKMAH